MVSTEDLRQIVLLGYLNEAQIEKLLPLIDQLMFDEKDVVFKEGDISERFYMLKKGKILLEKRMSDKITVSVGSVKAGFSFGWSAMLDGDPYTSDAICAEPCEVFSLRREKILPLMDSDPALGYILSQRLLRVMKKRLDIRTEQFLRAISSHPDMDSLV